MNRILIVLLSLSCLFQANAQNNELSSLYMEKLDSLVSIEKFEEALSYANLLANDNNLDNNAINNVSLTLYSNGKYDECIAFVSKWEKQNKELSLLFHKIKGYCYLTKGNNEEAEKYLGQYVSDAEKEESTPEIMSYLAFALSKCRNHKYKEAETVFDKFFSLSTKEENTSLERLPFCTNKGIYAQAFYNRAYNYLYQGDEEKGDYYLRLAEKAGNETAKKDRYFLCKNPSYAKPLELKKKYIDDYEETLASFSMYDDAC